MASKHGKGWRARWCDSQGNRQSRSFALKRDAEAFERRKKSEIDEIAAGLRAEKPTPRPFTDLADYWLENRASRKRSERHDQSILRKHLLPAFGALDLCKLGVADVDRFRRERQHLSPKTISNLLTLLIAMLNAAKDLGWLREVPRIRKPKVRISEKDFMYLRTESEITRVLRAAEDEGDLTLALYTTAIYTGLRKGELAALRWEDVDFDQRLIAVQRSFDGPTKAGDVRHVPILDALLPTLRSWRLRNPNGLLFPSEVGTMRDPASRIFRETFHRMLRAAGFEPFRREGKLRPYLTFHGLRHTFASQWMMRDGELFRLQRILGHKSAQMTQRYAHLAPDAFSGDWARFGSGLARGVTVRELRAPAKAESPSDSPATSGAIVAEDEAATGS